MAPFRSAHSRRHLLDIVADVALTAAGGGGETEPGDVESISAQAPREDAFTITQAEWDAAARSRLQKPPSAETGQDLPLPNATTITRRFNLGWRELVALSLASPHTKDHTLGALHGEKPLRGLTPEAAVAALQRAARRTQQVPLTRAVYRRERAKLLALRKPRGRHGRPVIVPNEDQIANAVGSWEEALRAAGLPTRPPGGDRGWDIGSISDALDRCLATHGSVPTYREFETFVRVNGIAVPRRNAPWPEHLSKWRKERAARGLPTPEGYPTLDDRPDYSEALATKVPDRRQRWDDQAACVEAMRRFLVRPDATKTTRRAYADWATGRPDAPAPSRLDQHGGFARVRQLAHDQPR